MAGFLVVVGSLLPRCSDQLRHPGKVFLTSLSFQVLRSPAWPSSTHFPSVLPPANNSEDAVFQAKTGRVNRPQHSFLSSTSNFLLKGSDQNKNLYKLDDKSAVENPLTLAQQEGDRCYQEAMEAFAKHEQHLEDIEQLKSQQQYEAMQKAFDQRKDNKDEEVQVYQHKANRAAGIAVVKAISKQTKKEASRVTSDSQSNTDEDFWLQQGRQLLRRAALEFKHKDALVRLGIFSLEEANRQIDEEADVDLSASPSPAVKISLPSYHGNIIKAEDKMMFPIEEALLFFEMGGYYGSSAGWYNLGHLLWNGNHPTLNPDKKNAMYAMHKATELGDADAMFFVGVHTISEGLQMQNGLNLVEQSALKGHGGALYWLALLHLQGDNELGIPADVDKFQSFLDRAALEQENSDALFLRSNCLYFGEDNYEQNFREALKGYLKAAELGHADAAVNAGAMYYHGVCEARDLRRAFELYQVGAELGSKEGWKNVVWCYLFGEGVPKCENTANYITRTMLQDNDDSDNNMAATENAVQNSSAEK